jgi:heme-degrading monooxygenase HmoA
MFAVVFEVQPKKELFDTYLELAKQLKPKLEAIDGFIDNERFESQRTEGRLLSLSTWRDEKSVVRWRTHGEHHGVQEKGRFEVFEDYHLRVGEIVADTAPPKGMAIEQKRFDATEIGEAKFCSVTEVSPADEHAKSLRPQTLLEYLQVDPHAQGLIDHEIFESIYTQGKLLVLGSWRDERSGSAWKPRAFEGAGMVRHRQICVIRDYGMFERREAPQYYPQVDKPGRKQTKAA